ncbi:MAG: YiiD C-terminal domain-containing protein [Chromatiaceae bacterium]|nr:YiiD C-terminal domain-containing protein [Gammaproteobacteria bacterium]MCP5300534.1 YiiD C-terminal domain-containing protein [Chromatiaceae bacterium]MCP5422606.1 YiiD C-terminal domain-containing protein [Chromatiaceae bacterium]
MNDIAALESRIHSGIPLSRAMRFRICSLDGHAIRVEAPLEPNINVHGTGFAGSLYALGILTAWAMTAHVIARAGLDAELVVASATIRYRAPVTGDITCACDVEVPAAAAFVAALGGRGRARLALRVQIGAGPAAEIEAHMHAQAEATP